MNLLEGKNAKRCSNCDKLKHFNQFYKAKRYKYERASQCKECQREKGRSYYHNNKERFRKYRENNKELIKQYELQKRLEELLQESISRNWQQFRDWVQKERDCSKCGKRKPFDEFYSQQKGRYGLKSHCKSCHKAGMSERSSEYYDKLKELRETL